LLFCKPAVVEALRGEGIGWVAGGLLLDGLCLMAGHTRLLPSVLEVIPGSLGTLDMKVILDAINNEI
jgi:hypothetical protein